ncbi:MAG: hypothetical protein KGL78_11965 [Burkholderiales bacterium]|nr:hypothetical protein [Burkholderiales bacterium]
MVFGGLALLAGCATRAPAPTAPGAPGAQPGVAPGAGASSMPGAARSWGEFRRLAAERMVAAQPDRSYLGKVPDILFGIPVIETELNADGTVRSINVLRRPSDPAAADTVQLAIDAIRRAAPYGDVSRLPRPWKWVETFLFDDERRFKPRSLD